MPSHKHSSRSKGKKPAKSNKSKSTVAPTTGSLLEPGQSASEFRRTYTHHPRDRHHHRQHEVNRGDTPRGRSTTQHGHFAPDRITAWVEEGRVTGYEGGSSGHSSDGRRAQAQAAGHRSKARKSQISKDLMRTQQRHDINQIRRRNKKKHKKSSADNGCCVIF